MNIDDSIKGEGKIKAKYSLRKKGTKGKKANKEQNIINDDNTLLNLKDMGFSVIGTYLGAKKSVYDIDFSKKSVIIIGNEANGISDEVMALCDEKIIIPMVGKIESLNAAISCGICVYEALRQNLNK